MPATLSLAMIVKNEDQVLGRVLEQAQRFCDELVIVDTGSTDQTVSLANSYGAKVYPFDWINDFSAARNHAFAQCTGDWIIWLDADDVIPELTTQKILELKAQTLNNQLDAVMCSYQIAFAANGECLMSMPRARLLRRDCGGSWQFPIHEVYTLPDKANIMDRLDINIEHRKPAVYVERSVTRNLDMLTKLIEEGNESGQVWYYYGKELRHHQRFEEAIQAFSHYVQHYREDVTCLYQTMHMAMTTLMELERPDEAIAWGMQAIEVNSARAEALTDLGVIYFRKQAFNQAIPMLLGATACQKPASGMIAEEYYTWKPYHYLSLCYEGAGDFVKAIEAALKAYPTIPDKQVIQKNIICFTNKLPLE